jgi:uncharacterized protein (UPF0548 family)
VFLLRRPNTQNIAEFLDKTASDTFSYPQIGATAAKVPNGYNVDHNRLKIGTGDGDFELAEKAIREWKMFDFPWVRLWPNTTPIEVGRTVAIVVEHFGFYSMNAARIVYVIDEQGDVDRFGFAYGTLTEHGEIGEERFSVEYHRSTGEVWYDLFAFSRPGSLPARIGYPLSRYLQRSFASDSLNAMKRAVERSRQPGKAAAP